MVVRRQKNKEPLPVKIWTVAAQAVEDWAGGRGFLFQVPVQTKNGKCACRRAPPPTRTPSEDCQGTEPPNAPIRQHSWRFIQGFILPSPLYSWDRPQHSQRDVELWGGAALWNRCSFTNKSDMTDPHWKPQDPLNRSRVTILIKELQQVGADRQRLGWIEAGGLTLASRTWTHQQSSSPWATGGGFK